MPIQRTAKTVQHRTLESTPEMYEKKRGMASNALD